jgi:hypothetical protein
LELAARSGATWIDPKLLGGAIQAGRAIGLRRAAPALALGVLAFGLGMHGPGRDRPAIERDEENGDRDLAEAAQSADWIAKRHDDACAHGHFRGTS